LDAVEVGKKAGMAITPIIIDGDDVNHVVTEELKRVSLTQRGNPETTSRE
jgi:Malonate decarboxylase, alpha subunit, transporter